MNFQRVESGKGWIWITEGWELFMKNPGIWIVLALILFVVYFVLGLIPFLGSLASAVIGPALFGGMIYGARELDEGRSLEIPHLFQAFSDSDRTVPMLLLGLVPLAAAIVTLILTVIFGFGVVGTAALTGSGGATVGMAVGGGLLMFLVMLVLGFVVGALMLFAIPRVIFGHAEPIPAVKESLEASLANIGAFLIFALLYMVFAILAMIPFGLGFLILLPVMAGAVYSATKEVFGAGERTEEHNVTPAGPVQPGRAEERPAEEPGGGDEEPRTRPE